MNWLQAETRNKDSFSLLFQKPVWGKVHDYSSKEKQKQWKDEKKIKRLKKKQQTRQ